MSPIRRMSRRRAAIVAFIATLILALPMVVLASHQFDDVPNSHPFHNDIDALADAGITGGCSADNYCPGSFVTRGQMAAFLNRLGALAPGKVPKVNADRLDGYDAEELNSLAIARSDSTVALTGTALTLLSVTVDAPGPGLVAVHGNLTVYTQDVDCGNCEIASWVTDASLTIFGRQSTTVDNADGNVSQTAQQWIFEVDAAGTHTFHLRASKFGTNDVNAAFMDLTAHWTPGVVVTTLGGSESGESTLEPAGK
jgi:hypothetical protein